MTELLERGAELAALAAGIERAGAGDGGLVLIEGPPGVGKTALLDACAEQARESGMRVLEARGDPVMRESPFAVVRELLAPTLGAQGRLEAGTAQLAAPVFAEGMGEAGGPDRLAGVMHGLHWLIADLADAAPLLVCIDDAHWLDTASARFMEYLARRAGSMPLLLALARRSGESEEPDGLAENAARVLEPRSLSEDAAGAVVRARLGPRADAELARACHRASGGNPFYLRELLDVLAEEPERPSIAAALAGGSIGTGAISRTVLVRLARLGPDCERIAEAAAILAPASPLRHAAELGGLDRDRARIAADRLRSVDLLAPSAAIAFAHPIVREVVAAELPPSRRAELHSTAARMLAREGAAPEAVAAHLMAAEPYAEAWAVEALRAAARRALSQGAPEIAAAYLRRALAEPPAATERLAVLVELGDAEARLPTPGHHGALREALGLVTDPEQRAEIALKLGLALFGAIRSEEGRAVLERALDEELSEPVAEELEQALIGGGIVDLAGAPAVLARAERHFERARRGEVDDPRMLSALALAGAAAGLPASEVAGMARAALDDERLSTQWFDDGYVSATVALGWADRLEEAAAAQDAGIEEAQRRGWSAMCMQLLALRADTALRAGELRLAEEHGQLARDLAAELGAAPSFASTALAGSLLERGSGAAALELLAPEPQPGSWPSVSSLALRGRAHVLCGEVELGVREMLEAHTRTAEAGLQLSAMVDWAGEATRALAQLGRLEEARNVAERELAEARACAAPRRLGMALAARGRLEPGSAGIALIEEGVSVLDTVAAPLEHAGALADLGDALLQSGEREAAREPLATALDVASRRGATVLAERARRDLIASGARPRRDVLSGVEALTPAESRTARMAVGGLTNKAIAQMLFLSTKTVEKHLSQAYLKLGIAGRQELAGALVAQNVGGGAAKE